MINFKCTLQKRKTIGRLLRNMKGFSLVELLVVVAIMAVLFGMGTATLSSKKGAEVSQAGYRIADLAYLARQNALAKNMKTVLVVAQVPEGGGSRSAVSIWDASTTNQLEKWNLLPESVVATNNSGHQQALSFSSKFRGQTVTVADYYVFHPDGHMTDDLNVNPRLSVQPRLGNAGNVFELIFNPLTGMSRVSRP